MKMNYDTTGLIALLVQTLRNKGFFSTPKRAVGLRQALARRWRRSQKQIDRYLYGGKRLPLVLVRDCALLLKALGVKLDDFWLNIEVENGITESPTEFLKQLKKGTNREPA